MNSARTRFRELWLSAVVAAVACAEVWTLGSGELRGPAWVALSVQLVVAALLVWRRERPFVMTCVMTAVTVGWWLVEGDPPISSAVTVAFAVAAYSLGRHERDRRFAWAGLAVVALGLTLHLALDSGVESWEDVGAELPWDLLILGTWAVGALLRYREMYVEGVRRAAVAEERTRVARELHDVVVHGLTVMVVQAEAASALLDGGDTARAARALEAIQSVGRRSLTDLRRSVAVLRGSGEALRAPVPDLAALDELVAEVQRAGITVRLQRTGAVEGIAPAIQLAGYRIVQESLTNTLRHTAATTVDVLVAAVADCLTVRIDDGGPARPKNGTAGGGVGLASMEERVALVGGSLHAAPRGGGFRVEASFPLEGS